MIGDLLRAFESDDPSKYKQLKYSENLSNLGEKTAGQAGTNLDFWNKAIGEYQNALKGTEGDASSLVKGAVGLARNIQSRPNDPFGEYRGLLDYTLSKIQPNVINNMTTALGNRLRQQSLARGINTGLDSTYGRLQQNNLNADAYLRAYNAALGSAGTDFSRLQSARLAQDAAALGVTPQTLSLLNAYAARGMQPEQARAEGLNQAIMQGNAILPFLKGNVAAFIRKKSGLEKWADAADALKSGAWEGLSFYQNLMGMGGMGGGGGGGARSAAPRYPEMIRNDQINRGYGTPNYDAAYDRYLRGADEATIRNDIDYDYLPYGGGSYGGGSMLGGV